MNPVEHSGRRTTLDGDAFLMNCQHIALGRCDLGRYGEFDVCLFLLTLRGERKREVCEVLEIRLQESGFLKQVFTGDDLYIAIQHKRLALLHLDVLWHRNHLIISRMTRQCACRAK